MAETPHYPLKPIQQTITYPEELKNLCPLCSSPVKFKYNSGIRIVYTLQGIVEQRHHLFCCTNDICIFSKIPFNPSPRFDYSQRIYGKDVLIKIGEYHIEETSNPHQIWTILRREYGLPISESSVKRMCVDILLLTSVHIDCNTTKIIDKANYILVALDGQEPDGDHPALWNFTDAISGRLLMTQYLEEVNYEILHNCIEEIREFYKKPIIGFISDKQGSIRKCMETCYEDIPHQYCTFHFSTNLWNHLEKFTNNIYKTITKTVKALYIHIVNAKTQIKIPATGESISLRKFCKPLDKELMSITKKAIKSFESCGELIYLKICLLI